MKIGDERHDFERMMEELGKLGRKIDEGREEMKKQLMDLKEKWEEERSKMKRKMEAMEKRLECLVDKWRRGEEGEKEPLRVEEREEGQRGTGEVTKKLRDLEVKLDKREREERRNNVIIKGLMIGEREVKEVVETLWREMEVKGEFRGVKRVGGLDREGRGMALVEMESWESKRKVIEAKRKLRGRRERIDNDLTKEERRAKWKIEREADKERERGKRVNVGYMRMWVDGKMKVWDEVGEK